MIKNEEYIDYLNKVIACVNNGDYYSIKELSILNLNKLKDDTIYMKKELRKYIETNISKRELKNLEKHECLSIVNLYIDYLFNELNKNKELKSIVSIEEFMQGIE